MKWKLILLILSLFFHKQFVIPAQFEDKSLFLSPIKQIVSQANQGQITGLTVPHHLLAKDIIAKAYDFISYGKYGNILILSPDHYNLGDSNISVSEQNFSTVFGEVKIDLKATKKLEKLPFVHNQNLFYREHGIGVQLPFIKYYFPNTNVIIITLKNTTPRIELDQFVDKLKTIISKNTLIIQSTDFSHYLTPKEAEIYDQQTIKILNQSDPSKLFTLNQPSNIDSIPAQYVQMRLQNEFYKSKINILDHKNSQDYTKEPIEFSTSYIIEVFGIIL
jgi:poly-gamma-glutamate synthesis protein (capsule biosynthesis protein)